MNVAEGKESEIVWEKKASKKSQQQNEIKELCTGQICCKGKLSCCKMCPSQHKRECPMERQHNKVKEGMAKSTGKISKSALLGVIEVLEIVENTVQRTKPKRKTRTVQPGGYAEVEESGQRK